MSLWSEMPSTNKVLQIYKVVENLERKMGAHRVSKWLCMAVPVFDRFFSWTTANDN